MARNSAIRGSRIGAGPAGETARGGAAARVTVSFWCEAGHLTRPCFADTADVPAVWECSGCGSPAGRDRDNPPERVPVAPFKTHLDYLRERRSDADAEILLAEALARLRATD
jgi:RNA polymerase-binding protein